MRTRWRIVAWVLVAVATAGLFGAAGLGRVLVVAIPVSDPQAIFVLAGHEWERLPAAAAVARQFPNADVVLSLPGTVNAATCHDCERRVWVLVEHGVAAGRIRIMPTRVGNTYDEAQAALDFCAVVGVRRLIVVTSPYHARRALLTFRAAFGQTSTEIGIVPALAEAGAKPSAWWMYGYDRAYVVYESVGLVAYWLRRRF